MDSTVTLRIADEDCPIQVREYRGQRVVTFRDIDRLHKRPEGTSSRNFSVHHAKFIEGEDFFYLAYEELKSTNFVELPSRNGLTVLTESGYLMLVKSLTDELAWTVQREIVNGYFRGRTQLRAPADLLADPEFLVQLATRYRDEHNARLAAEQQVQELAPKGEFFDHVADATNLQGIARVAKMLGTGEIRFFRWLRAEGILMQNNVPYQRFLDDGYFEIKERTFSKPGGDSQTATTTYFTGRGVTWIQKRYAQSKRVTA